MIESPICWGIFLQDEFFTQFVMTESPTCWGIFLQSGFLSNLHHGGHIKTREYLQLSNDIFERITEYDDTNTNRSNKPDYML